MLTKAINMLNSSDNMQKRFKKNGLEIAKKYNSKIIANKWFEII